MRRAAIASPSFARTGFAHTGRRSGPWQQRQAGALLALALLAGLTLACKRERAPGPEQERAAGTADQAPATPDAPGIPAMPERFGIGTPISEAELAAWDIDVMPDGRGLPPGSGSAREGAALYATHCMACHGPTGHEGPMDRLAGGAGTLASPAPIKTVGSYWPHATTLFDYIRRSMPFTAPQSLDANQVYAITAYVLFLNDIVTQDQRLDARTLPGIEMPNREGFVWPDPRPDTNNQPCMHDCEDKATP